jgi:hypothetical protein
MAKTRRAPGAGHLFSRRDKAGRESWVGKWYADGRQVMRKVGPKRGPDGRGLDRRGAEARLRVLMAEEVSPAPDSRVGVKEAGEHLISHLDAPRAEAGDDRGVRVPAAHPPGPVLRRAPARGDPLRRRGGADRSDGERRLLAEDDHERTRFPSLDLRARPAQGLGEGESPRGR